MLPKGRALSAYCDDKAQGERYYRAARVVSGQPIARVGLSGKTEFPHLHLTLRHGDRIIDPFAFGAADGECGTGSSLWKPELQPAVAYRERSVLNAGFAPNPVTMQMVESGNASKDRLRNDVPARVALVRAIGLKTGDVQRLSIRSPDSRVIADHAAPPLEDNKAQTLFLLERGVHQRDGRKAITLRTTASGRRAQRHWSGALWLKSLASNAGCGGHLPLAWP